MTQEEFEANYVNQIICGDCLDVMRDWPDGCVDLVLTDPPYGVEFDYGTEYDDSTEAYSQVTTRILAAEQKVTNGYIAIFQAAKHLCECRSWFDRQWRLVAAPKLFTQIRPIQVQYSTDYILFWQIGNPDKWETKRISRDFFVSSQTCITHGERNCRDLHLCPRPLDTMLYLVDCLCPPTGLILDPYCGSGTTCVAAKKLGRRFIGIDISEQYCQIARERLKAVDTGVPFKETKQGQKALFE